MELEREHAEEVAEKLALRYRQKDVRLSEIVALLNDIPRGAAEDEEATRLLDEMKQMRLSLSDMRHETRVQIEAEEKQGHQLAAVALNEMILNDLMPLERMVDRIRHDYINPPSLDGVTAP